MALAPKAILALGFKNYAEYLQSHHWRSLRNQLIGNKPFCCACNVFLATELHHVRYDRVGKETKDCVIGVCHSCHNAIHRALDRAFPSEKNRDVQVRRTKDVIEQATGSDWRTVSARWANNTRNVRIVIQEAKASTGRHRKKVLKDGKRLLREMYKPDNNPGFTLHRCDRCSLEVMRGGKMGHMQPCQCGGYMRKQIRVVADP